MFCTIRNCYLLVPSLLIVQLLIISQSLNLIHCLSLTELHSTLPSNHNNNNNNNGNNNNRFKSLSPQEKTFRDSIRNLNHLYQQKLLIHKINNNNNRNLFINSNHYPTVNTDGNNYDLIVDGIDNGNDNVYDVDSELQYSPSSLPVNYNDDLDDFQANQPNYLIVKSPTINGINKRQDEVVMDIPLEYTSDIPYEFYPELWPSKQQKSSSFYDKIDVDSSSSSSSASDILSQVLAAKIANLLEASGSNEHHPQRKRNLVKRNNRNNFRGGRLYKVTPKLSPIHKTNVPKPIVDPKHPSHQPSGYENSGKDSKVKSRKFEESKNTKLIRIPLKSTTLSTDQHQSSNGDFAKLVNGRPVHVLPLLHAYPKVINSTALGQKDLEKSKKQTPISSNNNFRKIEATHQNPASSIDRKEATTIRKPRSYALNHQSSMKKIFNEGPRNIVKRSLSPRSVSSLIDFGSRRDGDVTIDGYNSNIDGGDEDDFDDSEISFEGNKNGGDEIGLDLAEGKLPLAMNTVSEPIIVQTNPWLLDEASKTLMRSLTVKRRKRGSLNINDDQQLTLVDLDEDGGTALATESLTGNRDDDVHSSDDDLTNSRSNKITDEDQLKISEIDEVTTITTPTVESGGTATSKPIVEDLIDFIDAAEIPTRIVKKDGVTEVQTGTEDEDNLNYKVMKDDDSKKSDSHITTKANQLKSTEGITRLLDGSDLDGDNETFLEEEGFSEGLISIADDNDDLSKLNKSVPISGGDGKMSTMEGSSSRSTLPPPLMLTNEDEDRLVGKIIVDDKDDPTIKNGSIDGDDQLLMETIGKGFYSGSKRKRSVTTNPYFGDEGSPFSSVVAQEAAKFTDVDDKLERIEETLILEALNLIKGNINGVNGQLFSPTGVGEIKQRIESRLNAAYDLEDMRLALADLHKIMQKMSTEDDPDDDDNHDEDEVIDGTMDDKNNHGNEIDDDREIYLDSIDKLSFSGRLESNDMDDGNVGYGDELNVKGDYGLNRNKGTMDHVKISTPNSYSNHRDSVITKRHHSHLDSSDECQAIQELTTDCSTVKDVVPNGPLQKIFGQACNWHEVCYSCGELFGLLSSDCDMGFLEQSRLACNDSASCEAASRLILMPLKSRRIFYKQKVPPMCYQQSCVEKFLLQSRR